MKEICNQRGSATVAKNWMKNERKGSSSTPKLYLLRGDKKLMVVSEQHLKIQNIYMKLKMLV